MKVPEQFSIWINLKRAAGNGAAVVLFLSLLSIDNPITLSAGFIFGFLGGSTNDIIGFLGNREAIIAHKLKKEGNGE